MTDRDLAAAGFTEEPGPDMIPIWVERCRHQPPEVTAAGRVKIKIAQASGGWSYDTVSVAAIVTGR